MATEPAEPPRTEFQSTEPPRTEFQPADPQSTEPQSTEPQPAKRAGARKPATRQAEVDTPHGSARYLLTRPTRPRGLLVLGHGAGGDVDARDLVAVHGAVVAAGFAVALVTQPYRVAGRRAPAPAAQLDVAWSVVVRELLALAKYACLFLGGRSSGARVACRTAPDLGATGVVALAFPLHPPGRPEKSRDDELRTGLPTLVVNGDRDAFGIPEPDGHVAVVVRPGETHALNKHPEQIGRIVAKWLESYP